VDKRKGASRYRGTARRPILAFFCVGEKSRAHPIHVDGARQCPNEARTRLERWRKKAKFICRNGARAGKHSCLGLCAFRDLAAR